MNKLDYTPFGQKLGREPDQDGEKELNEASVAERLDSQYCTQPHSPPGTQFQRISDSSNKWIRIRAYDPIHGTKEEQSASSGYSKAQTNYRPVWQKSFSPVWILVCKKKKKISLVSYSHLFGLVGGGGILDRHTTPFWPHHPNSVLVPKDGHDFRFVSSLSAWNE